MSCTNWSNKISAFDNEPIFIFPLSVCLATIGISFKRLLIRLYKLISEFNQVVFASVIFNQFMFGCFLFFNELFQDILNLLL